MAEPTNSGLFALYSTQFTTLLEAKLQQEGSVLRGKVSTGAHVGKMASPIQQINPITVKAPTGRFAPLDVKETGYTRRWVFPTEREGTQMIDNFDQLQTIVDPKGQIAEAMSNGMGRSLDDLVINAAFGTNQTGGDAGSLTAETYNTAAPTAGGFQVAIGFGSGVNTGLTVQKLIETKRAMRHLHVDVDRERPQLIIGSQQEADLLNLVEVVSTEFNDRPVLTDGKLTRFMGYDISVMERLPFTGTTRTCLVFVKSGLYLGLWRDMFSRITIRDDLSSQPFQLYTQMMFGATRTQPGKVFSIVCADTTGGDNVP